MKIVRIIARLNIGGPARNAVILTERGEMGVFWETVLVCGEIGDGEGDMGYLAREKGIESVVVPELGREISFWNDWRAFWKIYRIICREKPDIVHTHTAKAGTLGRLAALLYKITHPIPLTSFGYRVNVVHTFHGHVFHSYFGKCKTLFFIWIEKILALFTDRIVTVSTSLKSELVHRFRIAPERKFSVIELGFELDGLLNLPVREKTECINIGIVGRLAAIKNHRMLFRVVGWLKVKGITPNQSAKADGTGHGFKVKVIGDGELREELELYVKELGIADIVEFKGWIKDLSEIYRELDIVVLTSLNEGTPVSIIEAMAAARPVVATKVGGVSDIVLDGKSGYLAGINDDDIFAERLSCLIGDFDKRKKFGECGRELVRNRFSKERLIKDMEKLYNILLKK